MKGLWDITHEMHLINFIIDIRFQPVILFVANEVKKKKNAFGVHFISSCISSFGRIKLLLKCLSLCTDFKGSQV